MSDALHKKKRKYTASPQSMTDDEPIEEPAFSLATLGLQRVGTVAPPKPRAQPMHPIQQLNARGMPARIRKRNRLFYDDNIINDDKPLRVSLSPRKNLTPKAQVAAQQQQQQQPQKNQQLQQSPKTPSKLLKQRKGIPSRYMRSHDKNDTVEFGNRNESKGLTQNTGAKSANVGANARKQDLDKKVQQRLSVRLQNLLKLPRPHTWVGNEWFYSFIDKALLDGENDFEACLNADMSFLRTRRLMQGEWVKLRSLMGRPRRCSSRFLNEEREELKKKRQKLRFVQANRSAEYRDLNFLRDLPNKIPLSLPVGTRVTVRLYSEHNGLFSGTVEAFHSQTSTYRITFDRAGLGKRNVLDYDIASENFHEMMPLQSISKDLRGNSMNFAQNAHEIKSPTSNDMRGLRMALNMNLNKSDPLLGQEACEIPYKTIMPRDHINGVSVKFLENFVRLRRALAAKRLKIQRLRAMNNEAELLMSNLLSSGNNNNAGSSAHSNATSSSDESHANLEVPTTNGTSGGCITEDFQRRYASIIISMERLNYDIQDYLHEVQRLAADLTRDPQEQAMLTPTYLREKCREEAERYVSSNNHSGISNPNTLNLIKNLTTILVVASHLGSTEGSSAQAPKVLDGCMEEVKSSLHPSNVETFQKNVQLHLHHIKLGIGQNVITSGNKENNSVNKNDN